MKSSSSTTDASDGQLPEQIVVGFVLRPHGLRGEAIVDVQTDRPGERFAPGARLRLTPERGAPRELTVRRAVPSRGGLRVAFEGVADRDGAEALRGGRLEVPRSAVPPAESGSFYHFELVGCRCVDEREGELGRVAAVVDGPGGVLLELERPAGGKLLLPFVEPFLVRVDPAGRVIEWRLPEGLSEACASGS